MCGIFGAIRTSGLFDGDDLVKFRKYTDIVSYRGPDDFGYVALNVRNTHQTTQERFDAFLGSRRLSIIDLSPLGHMPMTDGKGRWITFNGEIFNYVELKQELQQEYDYVFTTGSDTEVVLAIYDIFGEDGFHKLNGMWAFGIVDIPSRRAILSRDRFSIKPLYYLDGNQYFYFASEIKQLLPLLDTVAMNEEVMMAFLGQALFDYSENTFYQRIRSVPPRSTMVICFDTGKQLRKTYWNFSRTNTCNAELGDIVSEFRDLLNDSVNIRLRSDVKVGVLLSGGLDSSSIAVLANQFADLETYSVVADNPRYDERRFIDIVAASGIRNTKIVFQPDQVRKSLEAALYHSDEPVGGFSVLAQFRLFGAIKDASDATVLLSGQGGDEILLGYLKFFFFHLRELLKSGQYLRAFRHFAMAGLQRTVTTQFSISEARRYSPFLRNRGKHILRAKPTEIPVWQCEDMRARQIEDIEHYSVPALTHYEDRNSSACSLEVRHPFLDHRLVDFVVNLPTEFKMKNGWTKYILREALHELPPGVRWRRDKQGFLVPEELWLKDDFRPAIESQFQQSTLSKFGILDDEQFLRHYRDFRNGAAVSSSEIARVFIAELWCRQVFN